ncbi:MULTISPECIES: TetR/AcrR family transcriptional regulator [unclassified Streptococcus]|uniref:TetR/AcrR family transcriptional regulator n=1 Tax=unclassified Streptococcus TaxID=2608887 RepID=UPI0011B72DFB|nr:MULTISPECIES: TetR/AcrR family transcriptional regulator [unclassified Streptococcus]TWT10432.1 hypothetical protein FRX54_04655 [Streptococcus sp. sy004]TWT14751.1 hypothetical protein FRX51_04055 [Streptococcus sp. sy010]
MARPKKSEKDDLATTKIEKAFLDLLEIMPYSDITVLRISQESGVNRNSFYYHYADSYDLAQKIFLKLTNNDVAKQFPMLLLDSLKKEENFANLDEALLTSSKHIMLYARNDSLYLNQLVKDLLKDAWFKAFGICEERLSIEERLQVNFIFTGLVAVLGSQEMKDNPFKLLTLSHSKIGKAIIMTLVDLAKSQEK